MTDDSTDLVDRLALPDDTGLDPAILFAHYRSRPVSHGVAWSRRGRDFAVATGSPTGEPGAGKSVAVKGRCRVLFAVMSVTAHRWVTIAALTSVAVSSQLTPVAALADPHNPH